MKFGVKVMKYKTKIPKYLRKACGFAQIFRDFSNKSGVHFFNGLKPVVTKCFVPMEL
jgi:hypothetical protein